MSTPLCTLHSHASTIRVGGDIGVYFSRIPVWVSPVWDRYWVTLFLASAMIISHTSAAGGPPSQRASIYTRLHLKELTGNVRRRVSYYRRSASTCSLTGLVLPTFSFYMLVDGSRTTDVQPVAMPCDSSVMCAHSPVMYSCETRMSQAASGGAYWRVL